MKSRWCQIRKRRAFTLIEALVALGVLGTGILGCLAAIQLASNTSASARLLEGAVDLGNGQLNLAAAQATSKELADQQGVTGRYEWTVHFERPEEMIGTVTVTVAWLERGNAKSFVLKKAFLIQAGSAEGGE